jgi:hypothetical protein
MKSVIEQGEIAKLRSDSGIGGISGEMHLLKHQGNKYALRICLDDKRAEEYSLLYNLIEHHGFFPKLLYKDGRNFLFEYLEGRDCTLKEDAKTAYEIGKIFALINSLPVEESKKFDIDKKFFLSLDFILKNKAIDTEKHAEISEKYKNLRKEVSPNIVIEVSDCIPSNFRISNGKVFLVDIESLKHRFLGRGIAKSFLSWFKEQEQRKSFIDGYSSVASADFLNEDYLQFSYIYYLIVNTRFKIEHKKNYENNIKKINLFLEGKLI